MFPDIRKSSIRSKNIPSERVLIEEIKPETIPGIRSLQVTKQLVFDNWEPLHKYTKAVLVYNPSPKTQRFLYEVPKSSVFSVDFPHPVKLAPYKSVKIIIYFRPRDNKNYSDKLFIRTMENEKIVVKLHAIATIPTLLGPEVVEFDMCGVSQTVEKVYFLENNSDKKLTFYWRALEPFKIDPSTSYLAARKKKTIKITFSPKRACFYTGMARCKNSVNDYILNVKLMGKAVYPYLSIHLVQTENSSEECRFNFGVVNVNSIATQDITMTNCLPVKTQISVSRSPMYNVASISPFSFSDVKAIVEPLGKLTLKVNYQPLIPDYNDSDVWIITVHGGFSSKLIHLSGISRGPAVTLNTSCLDFTETEKGSIVEKSIKISNSSKVATTFEFQVDCNESVFKFTPVLGELASESTEIIHVQFCPPYPLTYYRRIPCIIHLHEPVYLDLIGTAISSYSQPERLQQSHLELFWLQTRKGQFFFSDDELIFPIALPKPKPLPVDEYLYDGYHSEFTLISPPLSLDQHEIDFGECCANSTSTKVFSLTNHTLFVMTVTWMGGSDHVFFVKPLVAAIQPQRTSVFHLTFNPIFANQVFWSELEGFAHVSGGGADYLKLGNYSWPPWCLTLRVQGNTFMNTTMYRANYKLSSCCVQLPAVPVKSHAACTVLIINQTPKTKIIYHLKSKSEGLVIKPKHGMFYKNFTTITFGLAPRSPGPYLACVQLETNFDKKIKQDVIIEGVASQPILVLDYSTGLYFKPTLVGMTTQNIQMAHNISPIFVHFIWNFKSNYGNLLSVEPNEGTILPNGVQYFKWSFCPRKKRLYLFAATLVADSAGTFGVRTYTRQEITILGEGSSVCIVADPTQLNFTNLTMGMLSIGSLKIYNYSFCDLNIELTIAGDETDCQSSSKGYIDNSHPCVMFDVNGNSKLKQFICLPARCSEIIYLRLLPLQLGMHKFIINYALLASIDNCSYLISPRRLSSITVAGSYPALKILETRFLGVATKIRRDRAWQLLSIDKYFNSARREGTKLMFYHYIL